MVKDADWRESAWYDGARKAVRLWTILLLASLIWLLLGKLKVIGASIFHAGVMVVVTMLFAFGLPLSALLGLDVIVNDYRLAGVAAVTTALLVAFVNLAVIGALFGMLRGKKIEAAHPEKAPKNSSN